MRCSARNARDVATERGMTKPMSNSEYVMGGPAEAGGAEGVRRRIVVALTALAALAWTIFWTTPALHAFQTETVIGRGDLAGGLQAWHIFNMVFVLSTYGIRWLPGLVVILAAGWAASRLATRG
jgi:hypothetical protein